MSDAPGMPAYDDGAQDDVPSFRRELNQAPSVGQRRLSERCLELFEAVLRDSAMFARALVLMIVSTCLGTGVLIVVALVFTDRPIGNLIWTAVGLFACATTVAVTSMLRMRRKS
ncbi:hypothetical protein [Dactylosporangium matsuzakiense]|uniref:Uncharacterized protein n=1 Tax=Dactylosporangium matsuzakiense TaxID=53360 RepID=A0A9W6NNI3_9ACTN|nr:hypothetical protein [Dactylosporangium matsuzakiense]UWZ43906.1 hypothetical protein Dmats_41895 [Dactylosporangium matsuzakiense]GLL03253.1 hypothetical protein GCM10017581_049970 [Dactylosporangium matsuzakiense]